MEERSEFGKGFAYCLGLFLAHAERFKDKRYKDKADISDLWFSGVYDHLYELQIDETILGDELAEKAKAFRSFCSNKRNYFDNAEVVTEADVEWAINEAKTLLLMFDKKVGIDAERGTWQ